jgi:hypothetical protein
MECLGIWTHVGQLKESDGYHSCVPFMSHIIYFDVRTALSGTLKPWSSPKTKGGYPLLMLLNKLPEASGSAPLYLMDRHVTGHNHYLFGVRGLFDWMS